MYSIAPLFAVPFAFDEFTGPERLNAELRSLFIARENEGARYANPNPNTNRNQELFESHFDLFKWPEPCIAELREFCLSRVLRTAGTLNGYAPETLRRMEVVTDAWFHVTRRNGWFGVHNHPMATWSAVYCVSSGEHDVDQPESGALSFINPHSTQSMYIDPGALSLKRPFGHANFGYHLKPGQLVVFPSWVLHQVMPFFGEGERITVAMNCSFRFK